MRIFYKINDIDKEKADGVLTHTLHIFFLFANE